MSGNGETADTIHNIGKMGVADHLRLMADNQKGLDVVNASDRRSRDLTARISEAEAKRQFPDIAPPAAPTEADEVEINVDSPTTVSHNHYYAAPETTEPPEPEEPTPEPQAIAKPAGKLAKAAIMAALMAAILATGGGLGMGLASLLDRPPADTVDHDTKYVGGISIE